MQKSHQYGKPQSPSSGMKMKHYHLCLLHVCAQQEGETICAQHGGETTVKGGEDSQAKGGKDSTQ